jgi:hypothetical protein
LAFFASEIAIKDELSRNTANSGEYHTKFAACLKKVPRFRFQNDCVDRLVKTVN